MHQMYLIAIIIVVALIVVAYGWSQRSSSPTDTPTAPVTPAAYIPPLTSASSDSTSSSYQGRSYGSPGCCADIGTKIIEEPSAAYRSQERGAAIDKASAIMQGNITQDGARVIDSVGYKTARSDETFDSVLMPTKNYVMDSVNV